MITEIVTARALLTDRGGDRHVERPIAARNCIVTRKELPAAVTPRIKRGSVNLDTAGIEKQNGNLSQPALMSQSDSSHGFAG
jgi:hypothetical protein